MATVNFGATALPGVCTDIAEMADGTVWIGRYGSPVSGTPLTDGYNPPDYPFYQVNTGSLTHTHVAGLGRLQLQLQAGTAADAAGPTDAGAICGVVQIIPEGYALALATNALQVWRYSGAAWTVAAARTVARVGNNPGWNNRQWRLVSIGGEVYVTSKTPATCYRLRGSTLQQVGAATGALLDAHRVGPIVAEYFGTQAGVLPADHEVARWRGQWWTDRYNAEATVTTGATWHGFTYNDGQALVRRAGWDEPLASLLTSLGVTTLFSIGVALLVGDRYALHLFGSRNEAASSVIGGGYNLPVAYGAWCQYDNGAALSRDDLSVTIHAGQATGDTLWLLGHDLEASVETPVVVSVADASKAYKVTRPDPTEGVLVTGCTDPAMDGWYYVDGTYNGRDRYVHESGDYWIVWDGAHWIIVAAGVPGVALETDGTGLRPWAWPTEEAAGPSGGEGVVFVTHTDADREAVAVRVTTGEGLTEEAGFRAIVRCGDDAESATDYTTYEALALGHGQTVDAGATVRVGIVGNLSNDPPDVQIVTKRNNP